MTDLSRDEQIRRINAVLTAFPDKIAAVYKKAVKAGQTAAAKEALSAAARTYAVTKANLNDKNQTRRRMKQIADNDLITGEIHYAGYKLPLFRFDAAPREPGRDAGRKIRHMIGGRWVTQDASETVYARQKLAGGMTKFPFSFIAKMKSGHIGIFSRQYDAFGAPIKEIMGASVAEMVGNTVVFDKVEAAGNQAIADKADAQIQRLLAGG
jgi:hypothetical protein